ncbi:MAG TPA: hypothetical protein VHK27_15290 [Gammaproteobacteria bacterium]|nr:hypothetical protein [Gammaproteobacteria bacterium]
MIDKEQLVNELFLMDAQQTVTDDAGQREIAWYYARDAIEDLLEVERGTLNSYKKFNGDIEAISEFLDGEND